MILLADPLADFARRDIDPIKSAEAFAHTLDEKTTKAYRSLEFIRKEISLYGAKRTMHKQQDFLKSLSDDYGIGLFVHRNDNLILWSHNAVSPDLAIRVAGSGREIYRFENGWYRLVYLTDGIEEYVAAILIQQAFPYANTYLDNRFAPGFAQEGISDISTTPKKGAVKLRADHQYFYIYFEGEDEGKKHYAAPFIIAALLGGILMFWGLILAVGSILKIAGPALSFGAMALLAIGLRALSIRSGWPSYVLDLGWFNPSIYASSEWFPSLADFLINSILIFILTVLARQVFFREQAASKTRYLPTFLIIAALFAFAVLINHLLKGLVLNSNIPFDINVITNLSGYSIAAIAGSGFLYFSFFLLADTAAMHAQRGGLSRDYILLGILLISLVHILITHSLGVRDLIFVLWPVGTVLLVFFTRMGFSSVRFHLAPAVFLVAILAGAGAHNFIKYDHVRERNQRKILVENLSLNTDPIAELLFEDIAATLVRDKDVRRVFEENELHPRQILEDYIKSRYFTGYWSNYNVEIHAFLADSSAWGKLSPSRPLSFEELSARAREVGEPTASSSQSLYFLNEPGSLTAYLGFVPLHYNLRESPDGHFVVAISSKGFGQPSGFPALLMDAQTVSYLAKTDRYATAKYVNGQLRTTTGDFSYRSRPHFFNALDTYPAFVYKRGYEHLVSQTGPDSYIVVSNPEKAFIDKATVFSYLCALYGLLLFAGRGVRKWAMGFSVFTLNLNQKIQVLLVLLTLASMLLFAYATRFYIEENYAEKNNRLVKEKMRSVVRQAQGQLYDEEEISYQTADHVNRILSELSFVFYTDIHFFDPSGDLIASSQMRMFNEGLTSRKMDPRAFTELAHVQRTEFLHEEQIGSLTYISGYTPFYNRQGNLLGYLNLPYFARQAELEREIGVFLEAVVNIFVLLFILSILVGLFISQRITAPLRLIRESLSEVELGKANKIVGYRSHDEIGLLIAEYNATVAELEHHAERLAQSERESAWREMAKQVAHEIKNPLTPMKLHIQHLQRALDSGQEVDRERISNVSKSLIEQIDALTGIANAFSNFAKMPTLEKAPVDLVAVLRHIDTLYSGYDTARITLNLNDVSNAMVNADKDQLIRVFNNLVKNALQAIPAGRRGVVQLSLKSSDGGFLVCVTDNGVGVPPELQSKIFVPNFTTKSRGMGLGLAMSKNIVEQTDGRIWYESEEDKGSRFYVWLPAL